MLKVPPDDSLSSTTTRKLRIKKDQYWLTSLMKLSATFLLFALVLIFVAYGLLGISYYAVLLSE